MQLNESIRKQSLKNAFDYGKADAKGVVGKVIAECPDAKKDMKATMAAINGEVARVNALDKPALQAEMAQYAYEEKKEGPREWKLPAAEQGKVVTRFLPEPNGYLHLGHAKAAFLSSEVARYYGGTCLLRFDDTNPDAEKQEYVDAIKDGLQWLGLEFSGELYTSDRMPQLQQFGKKLVILGRAYACTCPKTAINENRFSATACNCRERRGGENISIWNKMSSGELVKGEAVIRLKADMKSANTVMRDPTLFRSISTPHYRQGEKYLVWPTYDFEVSISDSLDGVTHALRSKEYELRDELYYAILDAVNIRKPFVYDFSRLNIAGTALSKRVLRPLVESGKVSGWDDPRLPTLAGLRRRGIISAAVKEFVLRQGLGKQENTPPFADLLKINRTMLDAKSPHFSFIENPARVSLAGEEFFIPGADAANLKAGGEFRLKDKASARVDKVLGGVIECSPSSSEHKSLAKITWVSAKPGQSVPAIAVFFSDLLKDDGSFNESSAR
ncbi:MAG: glutamate--tRNA ligase family protein, partial [Candidatus Micrarchaeota archaeon]